MSRRHKYGVASKERRRWNGRVYDSRAEMLYASTVWPLLGEHFAEIVEQPRLWLGVRENVYVPDFLLVEVEGPMYYVDVKGMETSKFKRDLKLYRKYGRLPLLLKTIKGSEAGFTTREVIPNGALPHLETRP